jgi:hypothetical protein
MSPTGRTLKLLRGSGFIAGVVEKWVPGLNRRIDLFGWCDIIAIKANRQHWTEPTKIGDVIVPLAPTYYIQTCAGGDAAKRETKILKSKEAAIVSQSLNRILIISWRKGGPRGKRKTWTPKILIVDRQQFQVVK